MSTLRADQALHSGRRAVASPLATDDSGPHADLVPPGCTLWDGSWIMLCADQVATTAQKVKNGTNRRR